MIQSLLTQDEYDALSKVYNTYNASKRKAAKDIRIVSIRGKDFECGPPPNYLMGGNLSEKEIKIINKLIEEKLKLVRLNPVYG